MKPRDEMIEVMHDAYWKNSAHMGWREAMGTALDALLAALPPAPEKGSTRIRNNIAAAFWGQLLAMKQPEGGFGKSRIADPNYIDAQKVENIRLNEILDTIRLAKNPNTAGDESV